jgi:hypothetical protein
MKPQDEERAIEKQIGEGPLALIAEVSEPTVDALREEGLDMSEAGVRSCTHA